MRTRLLVVTLLPALLAFFALGLTGAGNAQADPRPAQPEATLVSVSPASFANMVNMPLTIEGSGLSGVISASLGTVGLRNLEVVSSTQITALAPWSIAPGVYTLTVISQSGPLGVLPEAVTVSQGSSEWTSNGPYGGGLYEVVQDPDDPMRMYVAAGRSGLWKSEDGGASWNFSLVTPFPHRVQIVYPTAGEPPVMYLGGDGGLGLVRSLDYGETWEDKTPADIHGATNAFVPPGQSNSVYMGTVNTYVEQDPLTALYRSDDRGDTWNVVTGTQGLNVATLAFDPDHPDLNMVLGTHDGKVYTTTNAGLTWSEPITVASQIGQLYYAPTLYNGHRSLFAIPGSYEGGCDDNLFTYKSTDGGQTWDTLNLKFASIYGLAFHDSIPGLMWAAVGDGYFSTDDGATWEPVGAGISGPSTFLVIPGSTSRETTTLFAATRQGLYKSSDGGDTWQESDTGLGAVLVRTIAISPFNADEAYAATHDKGLLHTFDGGRSWQSIALPVTYYDWPIALDPFDNGKGYFAGIYRYGSTTQAIEITLDHGKTFTESLVTLPPEVSGRNFKVAALAVDPKTPDHILVGLCEDTRPSGLGLVYASFDGGAHWAKQTTSADMHCISRLTFDPGNAKNNTDLVYAGSDGSGLLRSSDGGATWAILPHQTTTGNFMTVEVDPGDPNSIYLDTFAGRNDNTGPGGIFVTHDAGETWISMDNMKSPDWAVKVVRLGDDFWLYAATMNGLQFLRTPPTYPGIQWQDASGIAGIATVDGLSCASEDDRAVCYIGASGGIRPASSRAPYPLAGSLSAPAGTQNFPGGIYRSSNLDQLPPEPPGWHLSWGDTRTAVTALEVFDGRLFAGASNWATGGQIWTMSEGGSWTPASALGMSSTYTSTNPAIPEMVTFKDHLYASVGWGSIDGQIWRTGPDLQWTLVTNGEFNGEKNGTATVLTVYNDTLYAFVLGDSPVVEIWRTITGDLGSWKKDTPDGFGNSHNLLVSGAAILNGTLYVAVNNSVDGIQVWSTTNGTQWTQANISGFGEATRTGSFGMATLGSYMYVGVENLTAGGEVWRSDGGAWTKVVSGGFGDAHNTSINSLYTAQNQLFAVTKNQNSGLQVWTTKNGVDWIPLNLNGFGNTNNNDVWWSNSSAYFGNSFFVGTWYGQIWQYAIPVQTSFPLYLPAIRR